VCDSIADRARERIIIIAQKSTNDRKYRSQKAKTRFFLFSRVCIPRIVRPNATDKNKE
jgi:hypothetical protein